MFFFFYLTSKTLPGVSLSANHKSWSNWRYALQRLSRSFLTPPKCSREKCICGVYYCTTSWSRSLKSPQIPWRQVQFSLPNLDPNTRIKIVIRVAFLMSMTEWLLESKLWPRQVSLYFSKYLTAWRPWKVKRRSGPLLVASKLTFLNMSF